MNVSRGCSPVLVVALGVGLAAPSVSSAQAEDDDCQVLDTGPIPDPVQTACDAAEPVIDNGPVGAHRRRSPRRSTRPATR